MAIGTPVNTLAGASQTTGTTQALAIPIVAAGNILLIQSHARRSSTTLAPGPPTVSDTSAAPLAWTAVFSPLPTQVGVNPGTAAQWWWARADGAAKTVTVSWPNAGTGTTIQSSVASFTIGAGMNPGFGNQAFAGSTGTPNAAVTATFPTVPSSGINMLSFAGAGGSVSTIATGYTSLTNIASSPYRTGYDLTPGVNAVMGANFLDQLLAAVNIVEDAAVAPIVGAKVKAWSGSAWVEKPLARWNGSAWVQEAPKVWSGTAWVSSAMPPWTPPGAGGELSPTFSVTSSYGDYSGHTGDGSGMRDGVFNASNSVWASQGDVNDNITADLGAAVMVTEIQLWGIPADFDGWGTNYLDNAAVDRSDDNTNWTAVTASIGTGVDYTPYIVPVNAVCRYVRVKSGSGWLSVSDFRIWSG